MNECLSEEGETRQQMAHQSRSLDESRWKEIREKVEKWEMKDDCMTQDRGNAGDWRCGDERKRKENVTERDAAALNAPASPPLPTLTAIKAELQSNESRHRLGEGSGGQGFCSLCCVLCPLLMASRCGAISQVWLWKNIPPA